MQRKSDHRLWFVIGLLVAFILLSGALTQLSLAPGLRIELGMVDTVEHAFTLQERTPNPLGGRVLGLVVSVTTGLSIVLFIVAMLRRENRLSTIVAMIMGIALAFLLAGLVRPADDAGLPPGMADSMAEDSGAGVFEGDLLDEEDAVPENLQPEPAPWLWSIVVAACGVAGLVWVLRPYLRRHRDDEDGSLKELARGAASAIEGGAPLPDVIQRCYLEMMAQVERQRHIRRRVSMTPREFEELLLREGVPEDDVRGLTRLFEKARYASANAAPEDERSASLHLRRIADALDSGG